jgi:hypothetical protein
MAYGHAERNLALIRQLEAETRQLLGSLDQADPEQSAWLRESAAEGRPWLPPVPDTSTVRQAREQALDGRHAGTAPWTT